jgi:hypothetical protein
MTETDADRTGLRWYVVCGRPFHAAEVEQAAEELRLQARLRPRGRPHKGPPATPSLFPK